MIWLWRFWAQRREAREAAESARQEFVETQATGREVDRRVSRLEQIRQENHFAERIGRALRGTD